MKFEIPEENEKAIQKFRAKQNKIAKKWGLRYKHGGDLTYCFSSSGIGEIIYVVHNATGEELNLTDVSTW